MKLTVLCFSLLFPFFNQDIKIEFGNTGNKTGNWVILSDNVMGGRSEAEIAYSSNAVIVKGNVSLKNRGGFVSIKSNFGRFDLSGFNSIEIKFRTTAQKYAFTLENSRRWYEPAYKQEFSSRESNKWEVVILPLKNFSEEVIGRPTGNGVNDAILKSIQRLGISTSEKKEGVFQIEIEYIAFKKGD